MFRCLVLRHARAEDRAPSGLDADRRLTEAARVSMARGAAGLARIIHDPRTVVTSPLARARETADIVSAAFGGIPVEEVDVLASGSRPDEIMAWLAGRPVQRNLVLVGHEPDLGRLVSYALAASARSFYPMRQGEACLLEFPEIPRAGNATLEWAIEPEHLAAAAVLGGANS